MAGHIHSTHLQAQFSVPFGDFCMYFTLLKWHALDLGSDRVRLTDFALKGLHRSHTEADPVACLIL